MKIQFRADKSNPKIEFEKVTYDFGEVSPAKKYTGRFEFKNIGSTPLKITEVKKCCGIVAKLENEKTEYAPGESGVVNATYTAARRASSMMRQLHVVSNDPENPDTTLTIKAKIVPKVVYDPQRIEILVKGQNAGCPAITIRSIDNKPFSIKSFMSTQNSVIADFDPSVEATEFILHPEFHPDKMQGRIAGAISIGLTHPDSPRLSIAFRPIPEFTTTPRSLIVMNAQPEKPMLRRLDIKNNYGENFEIESVTSKNGSVAKVINQQKIDKGYRFNLEITPPARNETGIYNDTLNIKIKNGEKLEVNTYIRYLQQNVPDRTRAG